MLENNDFFVGLKKSNDPRVVERTPSRVSVLVHSPIYERQKYIS